MSSWGQREQEQRQKRKRPQPEMSQATLSPSPLLFPLPSDDEIPVSYERHRRISHPHNHSQGPRRDFSAVRDTSIHSQSHSQQQRPNLEHRASQTIVDLTDDVENPRPSQRLPMLPPRLGRSDSEAIMDVVDLTADDDELVFTGSRTLAPLAPGGSGRAQQSALMDFIRHERHEEEAVEAILQDPGLFVLQHAPQRPPGRSRLPPPSLARRMHEQSANALMNLRQAMGYGPTVAPIDDAAMLLYAGPNIPHLDYQAHAFAAPRVQPPQKPQYVAPAAAPSGFTRSPTEEDVVICPGCEEELVAQKVDGATVPIKKSGKAPTKSEREQHPFWVLKECGHVYCNQCFQNRAPKKGAIVASRFPDSPESSTAKTAKKICAVDDCDTEVNKKDQWVGLFL